MIFQDDYHRVISLQHSTTSPYTFFNNRNLSKNIIFIIYVSLKLNKFIFINNCNKSRKVIYAVISSRGFKYSEINLKCNKFYQFRISSSQLISVICGVFIWRDRCTNIDFTNFLL